VAPVDWEMAGIGPGVLDVAALLSGWGDEQRSAIVAGYGVVPAEALAAARLHIAMQWLGWSPGWTPPPEHARDWLAEALGAARELGI
jgi:thiamine kinase-like enzyme